MAVDTFAERTVLVEALQEISKLKDVKGRQQVIDELGVIISSRIQEFPDARSHIVSIVRACADIAGGIDDLLERVRFYDNDSTAWPAVERAAAALKAKLQKAEPDMSAVQVPPADRQHLALVIGISQYAGGALPGHELKPEQFTHLQFPADDAREIHRILQDQAGYQVSPLLNEAATLSGIMRGLDRLRADCTGGDATVLIYFSGHGVSEDNRHYLVPHDARRNDLFATALWSKLFEAALQEIPTQRLVVILDACHAGAIGAAGPKDAEMTRFDPEGLKTITPEQGRFVVASCQARQRSLEKNGHGIFTQHLLELLQCDDPKVFPNVEVDLFDLYSALQKRVKQTAINEFAGVRQEPFANFTKRTGVVLRVQTARRLRYLNALLGCLRSISGQPPRIAHLKPRTIERRLLDYVERGERLARLQAFYDYFDEGLRGTDPAEVALVEENCRDLVRFFDEAIASIAAPLPQSALRAASPPRADREPEAAARVVAAPADSTTAASSEHGVAPTSLLGASLPVTPPAPSADGRVVLDEDDCRYVLQDILRDPRAFREATMLRQLLARGDGVSPSDITTWLIGTVPRVELPEWEAIKEQIANRFMEKFLNGRKIARVNAIAIRVAGGD